MDAKAEKLALFRYGVIAPLILETLPRGELTRRAQEIAARARLRKTWSRRMKWKTTTLASAMLLWISGCATNGVDRAAFCDTAGPIYISQDDVLNPETERQILNFDEIGAKLCGWK